jgi:hypothetical protein
VIEGRIYQVRNQSSQDPLNFPIMLNNKLAALGSVVESADAPPTAQDYAVFTDLSKRLDSELADLNQVLASDLPPLNAKLAQAHAAPIEKRALAPVEQGSNARNDAAEEDDN